MFWVRWFMIQIEPAMIRKTTRIPKARARTFPRCLPVRCALDLAEIRHAVEACRPILFRTQVVH